MRHLSDTTLSVVSAVVCASSFPPVLFVISEKSSCTIAQGCEYITESLWKSNFFHIPVVRVVIVAPDTFVVAWLFHWQRWLEETINELWDQRTGFYSDWCRRREQLISCCSPFWDCLRLELLRDDWRFVKPHADTQPFGVCINTNEM